LGGGGVRGGGNGERYLSAQKEREREREAINTAERKNLGFEAEHILWTGAKPRGTVVIRRETQRKSEVRGKKKSRIESPEEGSFDRKELGKTNPVPKEKKRPEQNKRKRKKEFVHRAKS